jgi:hypothetical protein
MLILCGCRFFSLHCIRFGCTAIYYKPETEIDRDGRHGSTYKLSSQRAGTPMRLLRRIIQALRGLS